MIPIAHPCKAAAAREHELDAQVPVGDAILGLAVVDFFGLALGHRVFGNGIHWSGAAIGYYAVRMGGLEQIKAYQRYMVQQYAKMKGHS